MEGEEGSPLDPSKPGPASRALLVCGAILSRRTSPGALMQSQPHLCSLATSEASLLFPPPLCLRGRAGGGGSLEPIIEKGRSGGRRSGIGIAELQQTQQTGCLPWHRLDPRLPATMAPGSLSWLLSWATLCHLTMLLAGE